LRGINTVLFEGTICEWQQEVSVPLTSENEDTQFMSLKGFKLDVMRV
jgi:hypothetical protein